MVDRVFDSNYFEKATKSYKSLWMRPVWAIPPAMALLRSRSEIKNECNVWSSLNSKSEEFLTDAERDNIEMRENTQIELTHSGIESANFFSETYKRRLLC